MDAEIQDFLTHKNLDLFATVDPEEALKGCELVIIATPTDYDPNTNKFNTGSVEAVLKTVSQYRPGVDVVIKSTIPVGYTEKLRRLGFENVLFSPEFLREGSALKDNLYPSRIIVGENSERARNFANLLLEGAIKKDVPILLTGPTEAEAIKLFSNGSVQSKY